MLADQAPLSPDEAERDGAGYIADGYQAPQSSRYQRCQDF